MEQEKPLACTLSILHHNPIVSEMLGAAQSYNYGPMVTYNFLAILGWNSNSFTFTLLQDTGLLDWFENPPGWNPGWGKPVSGL